jgi:hypothetical protein
MEQKSRVALAGAGQGNLDRFSPWKASAVKLEEQEWVG